MIDKIQLPPPPATVRFPIETTIGAHSVAKRIEAYAWHLGMTVEVRTVGGWFLKTHFFKADGPTESINKLMAFVEANTDA